MKVFEQTDSERLIGLSYAFVDFVSTLSPLFPFFPFSSPVLTPHFLPVTRVLVAGTEAQFHELVGRLTAQAKAAAKEMKAREATQELEIAQAIASEKEKEVQ